MSKMTRRYCGSPHRPGHAWQSGALARGISALRYSLEVIGANPTGIQDATLKKKSLPAQTRVWLAFTPAAPFDIPTFPGWPGCCPSTGEAVALVPVDLAP